MIRFYVILGALMCALFMAPQSKAQIFGALDHEYVKGMWKYCYYTNGKVVTIKSYELCPITING